MKWDLTSISLCGYWDIQKIKRKDYAYSIFKDRSICNSNYNVKNGMGTIIMTSITIIIIHSVLSLCHV